VRCVRFRKSKHGDDHLWLRKRIHKGDIVAEKRIDTRNHRDDRSFPWILAHEASNTVNRCPSSVVCLDPFYPFLPFAPRILTKKRKSMIARVKWEATLGKWTDETSMDVTMKAATVSILSVVI
jgi:hypothetical protein